NLADVVDTLTRSRMMSGIRGKDTRPELVVRKLLHRAGFRYRLHASSLPGRPDLCFASRRKVVFVHGCFWHQHGCYLSKEPSTRPEFWKAKLRSNVSRDRTAIAALKSRGYGVCVIWECALKGRRRVPLELLQNVLA